MKALIITNGFFENPNNIYKAERLKEELSFYHIEAVLKPALELLPFTNGDHLLLEEEMKQYAFAINLDKDSYLADALDPLLPLFNNARSLHLSDDKMSTILALQKSGIKAPLTVSAPLCYISSPDPIKVKLFLDQVEKTLSYPLVFKNNHGSMGKQVRLIHHREELEKIYEENKNVPHLYEQFLSKHQGHDYRVMVVGKEVVAVMERVNTTDFRSNIALGGKGYDATNTLPESFKKVAIQACEILSLDYAGVDIAMDDKDDGPVLLEVNGNAFFTEIEKITKVNVTKKLVEHIVTKLGLGRLA